MWNSAIEFVEDDAAWAGGIKARGIPLVASSQTYRARRRTKKGRQIGARLKTFTFSQIKTQLKKLLKDKRNQIREQRWIPQVKRTRIEGRTSEKILAGTIVSRMLELSTCCILEKTLTLSWIIEVMLCRVECLIFCSDKRFKRTYPTPEGIGPVTLSSLML